MICFQKIVSLFWRTTNLYRKRPNQPLWFAFKKLYLCSDEQPFFWNVDVMLCCDLLSKNCIFVLTNNIVFWKLGRLFVVICFQKIVSLFWRTTGEFDGMDVNKLWFAFKKLYLCSDEQPKHLGVEYDHVVICFQKIVSLFWRTTTYRGLSTSSALWFAFKKLYLCSDEQQSEIGK